MLENFLPPFLLALPLDQYQKKYSDIVCIGIKELKT